jgi:peptidoglycan hydrolase-like protein with peptidoglycan-binding domain
MHRTGGRILGLVAAAVLPACASTSVASTPPVITEVTAVTTTTEAPTTTVEPTTTDAPTTTRATTTTTTTTTLPPTTTTTTIPVAEAVDPPITAVGSSNGAETERAQWRLLDLGFWLESANGEYGTTTRQAVMAFQKYYGLEADGVLGPNTAAKLSEPLRVPTSRADAGTLVEVDKGKQLLFFVTDGSIEWVLNTSTGTEIPYEEPDQNTPGEIQIGDSITRNGLHEVYREREEGWWEGDLGEIYRPKYFSGGLAVHGSNNVPNVPASHGCVRVSVQAMDWIWEIGIMPMDTPVWVHEG